MIEQIIQLDHQLFFAINNGLSNFFFDWLMPILRNKYVWIPLYIFIIAFSIKKYKIKGVYLVLFLSATAGFADFTSAKVMKPAFERLRPCNDEALKDRVIARVGCGSGKSFPSTHATDHFAIAVFLISIFYKRWRPMLSLGILWAASISFAQVYVGVHFPLDITVGALYGSLIGYIFASLYNRYVQLPDKHIQQPKI